MSTSTVGKARVVEGQAARGVLVTGVEGEPLDRLTIRQAIEALEDHHHCHDHRRDRAAADLGEEIT